MVFYPDSHITFGYQVEDFSMLALIDNAVFWKEELSGDIVDDEVNQVLFTFLEDRVGGHCIRENVLGDFIPETWRYHQHEAV